MTIFRFLPLACMLALSGMASAQPPAMPDCPAATTPLCAEGTALATALADGCTYAVCIKRACPLHALPVCDPGYKATAGAAGSDGCLSAPKCVADTCAQPPCGGKAVIRRDGN